MVEEQNLRIAFEALRNTPPLPPLKAAQDFLDYFFNDADGWEDAKNHISRMNTVNNSSLTQGLQGIEALLINPPEKGKLSYLVAVEANLDLEDPSDEGAKQWLRKVAEMVREVLGDAAPPRA